MTVFYCINFAANLKTCNNMNAAIYQAIADGTPGVTFNITAADLCAAFEAITKGEKERTAQAIEKHREAPTMTRAQAAKALNVDASTLWRWAKCGYLTPVKIGTKVLYRASDIDRMLNRKQAE